MNNVGKEKSFENKIKEYLKANGIYPLGFEKQKMKINPIGYYEKRFANRNTGRGLPDMHVVIYGFSLEVEIKAENGEPSDLQLKICNQMRESNAFAVVLFPSGFDDFKDIINIIKINKSHTDYNLLNEHYSLILK